MNTPKRTYVVRRSDSGNYHTGIDFGTKLVANAHKIESDEPPESLQAKVRVFFGPHARLIDVTPAGKLVDPVAADALVAAADALVELYRPVHPLAAWVEFRAALAEFKKYL